MGWWMDHHDLSASIQDYAKEIYELETSEGQVRTSMLAERLGVSAPSVSGMIRTLVDRGLVAHEPYRGVTLTPEGERVALGVIRHHRLLELFLAESLGVPWGRVHEEAELLEHAISEELEEQIAAKLDDPSRNPYGEPIPSREGTVTEVGGSSLADLDPGQSGIFVEIPHAEPGVLGLLDKRGIRIGARIELIEKTEPGSFFVRVDGQEHVLDENTASAMRVVVAEEQ
jgi:DtxR family Mn-dependent transcriptional regulator